MAIIKVSVNAKNIYIVDEIVIHEQPKCLYSSYTKAIAYCEHQCKPSDDIEYVPAAAGYDRKFDAIDLRSGNSLIRMKEQVGV